MTAKVGLRVLSVLVVFLGLVGVTIDPGLWLELSVLVDVTSTVSIELAETATNSVTSVLGLVAIDDVTGELVEGVELSNGVL